MLKNRCATSVLLALALLAGVPGQAADAPAPTSDGPPARVVIVGAGLAGLITAYELQNLGVASHILEANTRLGGRVATADYGDGLKAEYGMHEMWTGDPVLEYAKKFGLPLSEPERPYSSVLLEGKVHPLVQDSMEEFFAALFTAEERHAYARWLKECEALYDEAEGRGLTPRLAELQKISFAAWVKGLQVPARVAEFIRLGLECEIATDWDSISAVYGIQQSRIFLHGTEQCYHARAGNVTLTDALAQAHTGPKTLGAQVTRIVRTVKPGGGTEAVVHFKQDNVVRSVRAEKVVVAVPYHMLHAIQMEPSLTADQWKAVDGMVSGIYAVVHFIIGTEAVPSLLVDGKIPFPVLTRGPLGVVYGFLEKPEPGSKELVFTLLIHGDYARSYLEPQDQIRRRLLAELDKLWPGFSGHVRAAHFYGYHPAATPGWPPGRSPLDALHATLREENAGLYLVGDYIHSSHADGAVRSARDVARKIAQSLGQ